MSETLTKEILVDAIQKSKETTISGVWKYLGHKSVISGSQGKRIRELIPNHLELLEANKKGTIVNADKTQVEIVAKVSETHIPTKEKSAGGFRDGSNYAVLFTEGNKDYITKKELITRVAKLTNRSEVLVGYDYGVMGSKKSKSNGRANIDRTTVPGKIKIVPKL